MSYSFVLALVLVPPDDIARSVPKDHILFMYVTNSTTSDNHQSGIGPRRVV